MSSDPFTQPIFSPYHRLQKECEDVNRLDMELYSYALVLFDVQGQIFEKRPPAGHGGRESNEAAKAT